MPMPSELVEAYSQTRQFEKVQFWKISAMLKGYVKSSEMRQRYRVGVRSPRDVGHRLLPVEEVGIFLLILLKPNAQILQGIHLVKKCNWVRSFQGIGSKRFRKRIEENR